MLTVTINGVHESAHAMQSYVTATGDHASSSENSVSHQYPGSPHKEHKDCDGCDTCINCACHAPLPLQQFQLSHIPIIIDLRTPDPFTHLPEVFLSKFIPPQNHA